jgi:hypothetical protein
MANMRTSGPGGAPHPLGALEGSSRSCPPYWRHVFFLGLLQSCDWRSDRCLTEHP